MRTVLAASAAISLLVTVANAATFNITFTETALGVEAVAEGAFDTTQMSYLFDTLSQEEAVVNPGVGGYVVRGAGYSAWSVVLPNNLFGPPVPSFGTASGDYAGFEATGDRVYTPLNYQSGAWISNTVLFGTSGDNFATLSLLPGQYVYDYGDDDSIVVSIGAVPLPASLPLLLAGLGGVGLVARRRRKLR